MTTAECPPLLVENVVDSEFIDKALTYAERHKLKLVERLGYGIHGIIHAAENKTRGGNTAVKVHREQPPYLRERDAYLRLRAAGIRELRGFNVPQFIGADDELGVIEMTIVARPFVLDFAGAYLDQRPQFSADVWADWEAEKRIQFDDRWPVVGRVLDALEGLAIYMVDVSPTNLAFED